MAQLYREAAGVLRAFLSAAPAAAGGSGGGGGGSLQSLAYAPAIQQKKAVYALVLNTLKFQSILDEVLKSQPKLVKEIKAVDKHVVLLMLYDLLFGGRTAITGGGELKKTLTRFRPQLTAYVARLKIRAGVKDDTGLLPKQLQQTNVTRRYVRVNGLKTSLAAVMAVLARDGIVRIDAPPRTATASATSSSAAEAKTAAATTVQVPLSASAKLDLFLGRTPAAAAASSSAAPAGAATASAAGDWKRYYVDCDIPDLLVFESGTAASAYFAEHTLVTSGQVILQDKASCMPALVLASAVHAGSASGAPAAAFHVLDACSAPGNKSTHIAALLHPQSATRIDTLLASSTKPAAAATASIAVSELRVDSIEMDPKRYQTLRRLVARATTNDAAAIAAQPNRTAKTDANADADADGADADDSTASGGDEKSSAAAPAPASSCVYAHNSNFLTINAHNKSSPFSSVDAIILDPTCSGSGMLHRIEHALHTLRTPQKAAAPQPTGYDITPPAEERDRVTRLATFQKQMLSHALSFPHVKYVVYSTCSIYAEEDEDVVASVVGSSAPAALRSQWRLVTGALPGWTRRGIARPELSAELGARCVRVHPELDRMNGFFVACFERTSATANTTAAAGKRKSKATPAAPPVAAVVPASIAVAVESKHESKATAKPKSKAASQPPKSAAAGKSAKPKASPIASAPAPAAAVVAAPVVKGPNRAAKRKAAAEAAAAAAAATGAAPSAGAESNKKPKLTPASKAQSQPQSPSADE